MIEVLSSFKKEESISLGNGVYKVRIGADNIGKSGGYRLIIWIYEVANLLIPVCIYAKSEQENISEKERNYHLEKIKQEMNQLDY